MFAKKIGITDTTLRDAQQSLIATRMKTSEMIPVAEVSPEDMLTYALFPDIANDFLCCK